MSRREDERETERPHYYSQFWLDVAAGRRVIGESTAPDTVGLPEAVAYPPGGYGGPEQENGATSSYAASPGQVTVIVHDDEEPENEAFADEPYKEPEENLDIFIEDTDLPDLSSLNEEEDEEEEESFEDEDFAAEEDEEEEDIDWDPGSKKPKVSRSSTRKVTKHDPRHSGY